MGAESKIEWTDATWPVVKGCDYVSPGCANCYAVDLIHRHSQHPNEKISLPLAGLTEVRNGRARWTGTVYLNEPHLSDPLKWKKGRMIFVPSHGDLFHEDVPDEFICRVFKVMGQAKQHTFQVLTKRAERMARYIGQRWGYGQGPLWEPAPNVWLGVSVENQAMADERIPHLLKVPAAVRFLSCEPLLEPVELSKYLPRWFYECNKCMASGDSIDRPHDPCGSEPAEGFEHEADCDGSLTVTRGTGIEWVIVGGESGPDARPFNVEWARSLVRQCKAAGVACFVKQMGQNVRATSTQRAEWPAHIGFAPGDFPPSVQVIGLKDRKGGDPEEWPADLRVREFPTAKASAA